MRGALAVAKKEILSYFFAPMAYIVIAVFLLMNGFLFSVLLAALSQPGSGQAGSPMIFFFGGSLFTWLFLLVTVPAITMRLGAEEAKSGTLETLLTAPVTDLGVVTGKYLGALAVYAACWLPTLLYCWVLAQFSEVDPGPVASGYLGVLLVGMFFTAVGLFTSFASRNQLVAAVTAIAILVMLFLLAVLSFLITDPGWKEILEYVDLWTVLQTFAKGVVDSRAVVYLLSGSVLFLALAHQALVARRWSR